MAHLRTIACLEHILSVLSNTSFYLNTGRRAEGTNKTPSERIWSSVGFSDIDMKDVLYQVRVLEEGDALPQEYDNYIYCQTEKGRHISTAYYSVIS